MNRSDRILKLIVEEFIKNAQPVSSKALIEAYDLRYSSATIRSEMNALEKAGYLEKMHTSSGRVPSSKGYRYYIDNLRGKSVDRAFKYHLQNILEQKVQSVEEVIRSSCEILSQMSNLASIVLGPSALDEHLVAIQIIPISESSATAVFVTDQGYVENKTFVISKGTSSRDVERCVRLLNDRLRGTAISELVQKMELIRPLLKDYVVDHDLLYQAFLEAFVGFARDRLSAYGQEELLGQPEFAHDADKMRRLLELLEKPEVFRAARNEDGGISVHVGGESASDEDVSIVSAKVNVPGQRAGSIAIVGPKRMDYAKVVSALEYLVKELEKHFQTEKARNGKESGNGREGQKED